MFSARRRTLRGLVWGFLLSAALPTAAWAQAGSSPDSVVQPLWRESWFQVALASGLLLLFAIIHRIRVNNLERRQFELMVIAEQRTHGEARYRELFENATDAAFTTDLDGNFTELNRKAETLIGYDRNTDGLNLKQLLPENEESPRVLRHWLDGVADNERVDIVTRSGERVPVEVSTRLVEAAGKAVGIQGIARDVRERDALERQLRQSQKMEAVGQLAGGVAHDFNNLLTVIRGNAELLIAELPPNDPARNDVEQITQAADRAAALTRQLLAFSRKQVVQPRELDLNELLAGVEKMLQRLIGEDLTILTLPLRDPALVKADPGQLEQVMLNLVVNARDAMPDGGTITIETAMIDVGEDARAPVSSASGRAVVLSVTDTGTGMDAATQARISSCSSPPRKSGREPDSDSPPYSALCSRPVDRSPATVNPARALRSTFICRWLPFPRSWTRSKKSTTAGPAATKPSSWSRMKKQFGRWPAGSCIARATR